MKQSFISSFSIDESITTVRMMMMMMMIYDVQRFYSGKFVQSVYTWCAHKSCSCCCC